MKVLHVIFSTNRLKYLYKSLESHAYLVYGNNEIDRLVIDDYPRTRNDAIFDLTAKAFGFRTILHKKNEGLSVTWSELFDMVKDSDYDYVLHQEDDVTLNQFVYLDDMLEIMRVRPDICGLTLKRQPWYFHETPSKIEDTDQIVNGYPLQWSRVFSPMFTLYPRWVTQGNMREVYNCNINEGMLIEYWVNHVNKGLGSYQMRAKDGGHLIEHIGEETHGIKLLPNEPNYEIFAKYDPDKVYSSKNGDFIRA